MMPLGIRFAATARWLQNGSLMASLDRLRETIVGNTVSRNGNWKRVKVF